MLTKLKQKIQATFTVEAKAAYKIGLTPNRLSLIGLILAFSSAIVYTQWQVDRLYLLYATALLLLSGFCDVLDGLTARLHHKATFFGGFLDSLLDRYADAAVYVCVIISGLCDALWGLVALVGSLLVSYSRARAEAAGLKLESIGIAERAERMIILAIVSVAAFFYRPELMMNAGMILIAMLSNLTVMQRSIFAYRMLKKKETG